MRRPLLWPNSNLHKIFYTTGDGATSEITREQVDGQTTSVTHKVTKDGETIHQHQEHIGKEGTIRTFPEEWTRVKKIGE